MTDSMDRIRAWIDTRREQATNDDRLAVSYEGAPLLLSDLEAILTTAEVARDADQRLPTKPGAYAAGGNLYRLDENGGWALIGISTIFPKEVDWMMGVHIPAKLVPLVPGGPVTDEEFDRAWVQHNPGNYAEVRALVETVLDGRRNAGMPGDE